MTFDVTNGIFTYILTLIGDKAELSGLGEASQHCTTFCQYPWNLCINQRLVSPAWLVQIIPTPTITSLFKYKGTSILQTA